MDRAAGVVREGLLRGPRRRREGRRQGDHPRVPEAGPGEPPRRQPGRRRRRGALQGDLRRPTTSSATPRSARSTTRSAPWARWAASAARAARRLRRPGGGPAGSPSTWAAGRRHRRRPRQPVRRRRRRAAARSAGHRARSAAPTSRPSSTSDFTDAVAGLTTTLHLVSDAVCHTCTGSGAEPGTTPDRAARTCAGRGVGRRRPGHVRHVAALPHLRRPRRAASSTRATPAAASASSAGPARSRSASPPASPTASASGSRAAATPAATAARPATSTSPAASSPTRCSPWTAGTCASPCRSPSPRPPSAPTSRCPPSTAARSRCGIPAGTRTGPHVPGQGPRRRHRPRAPATCWSPSRSPCPPKLSDAERAADRGAGRRRHRVAARAPVPTVPSRRDEGGSPMSRSPDHAVYVISVAAELAGVHPQTLRIYERKGLVDPARTQGGSRRYSDADIELLQAHPGPHQRRASTWPASQRVLLLEEENRRLRAELERTREPGPGRGGRGRAAQPLRPGAGAPGGGALRGHAAAADRAGRVRPTSGASGSVPLTSDRRKVECLIVKFGADGGSLAPWRWTRTAGP